MHVLVEACNISGRAIASRTNKVTTVVIVAIGCRIALNIGASARDRIRVLVGVRTRP